MLEFLPWLEVCAEPKVCQLELCVIALGAQQEVLGLDVAVHNTQLVQVVHDFYHRSKVICKRSFRLELQNWLRCHLTVPTSYKEATRAEKDEGNDLLPSFQ